LAKENKHGSNEIQNQLSQTQLTGARKMGLNSCNKLIADVQVSFNSSRTRKSIARDLVTKQVDRAMPAASGGDIKI